MGGHTGTLVDLDAPPRQILIDAKIYEVSLFGTLSSGVSAYLRNRSQSRSNAQLAGGFDASGMTNLSIGIVAGSTRELALFLRGSATGAGRASSQLRRSLRRTTFRPKSW